MKKLICFIFGHNTTFKMIWYPHILSEHITKYETFARCKRCPFSEHKVFEWKDETFVEVENE